jgi:hypothetical protein
MGMIRENDDFKSRWRKIIKNEENCKEIKEY